MGRVLNAAKREGQAGRPDRGMEGKFHVDHGGRFGRNVTTGHDLAGRTMQGLCAVTADRAAAEVRGVGTVRQCKSQRPVLVRGHAVSKPGRGQRDREGKKQKHPVQRR